MISKHSNKLLKAVAISLVGLSLGISGCREKPEKKGHPVEEPSEIQQLTPIEQAILLDADSPFHLDLGAYGEIDPGLAIGVFDSGTGGLTVLDALVRYDGNDNASGEEGPDGIHDFAREKFIYLADQANMPYGNYHSEDKTELLKEHIIKDVHFLLSNRYHSGGNPKVEKTDKQKIKAVVVACNTATAYGMQEIEAFMGRTGLDIPVIGVIDAGARGVLREFEKDEDGAIGVFATVGTIASQGYGNTILRQKEALGYGGEIQIYDQGGHGVAEAIDGEPDFIDRSANSVRDNYRGPALGDGQHPIDRTLMDVYNFNFDHGKMLCDTSNQGDCGVLQINDTENYIRYHLVSLMEKVRNSEKPLPLKALVLGCTHYPYMSDTIKQVLGELYDYKGDSQEYVYRDHMVPEVKIIDPAVFVAKELHDVLKEKELLNDSADMMAQSEFYISVPNLQNGNTRLDGVGKFTYDYKYGRETGNIQEYVKRVPFNRDNIPSETLRRLETSIPTTYGMIVEFNNGNPKLDDLPQDKKIKASL